MLSTSTTSSDGEKRLPESMEIPVGDIDIPSLKEFLAYWETLRGEGVGPSWEDFNLLALDPKVIPYIIVVDVLRDPLNFLIRFWGTAHVTAKGFDKTGKMVDDPPRFRGTSAFNEYSQMVKEKRPLASKGMVKFPHLDRLPFTQTVLRLPLSDNGMEVDKFVSLAFWEKRSR